MLDLGAGTGQFTLAVAPICSRVVAADVSPAMQDPLVEVNPRVDVMDRYFASYVCRGGVAGPRPVHVDEAAGLQATIYAASNPHD